MTKREKILTIILAGIIVAYGYYQAAYGTNESDYKYGYKDGLGGYLESKQSNNCATVENPYDIFCEHYRGPINPDYPPTYNVDNETACQHGYHHGWVRACLNDGGGAMCTAWHDGGPVIAATTGPGHCYNTTKEGETCVSGNFIPTH